jgi:hypothetical protein
MFLRANNMLNSMVKLFGQPSVRNKHESDHYVTAPASRFSIAALKLASNPQYKSL